MQVLVVGAGVIGLAVARTAALAGHEVTVAEMTGGIANGISSRNSEVIHAGLYYPTDSLRARYCVRGRIATWPRSWPSIAFLDFSARMLCRASWTTRGAGSVVGAAPGSIDGASPGVPTTAPTSIGSGPRTTTC